VNHADIRWNSAIQECDLDIRSGRIGKALARLNQLPYRTVPRKFAEPIAHLYYRSRNFNRCLEILSPFVRPADHMHRPTDAEAATYAIALIKIGSVAEGMQILIDLKGRIPEADLYMAFAYQAMWDYGQAIPHLERYIQARGLTPYQVAIAKVNLIAACISSHRPAQAEQLLTQLLRESRDEKWTLLFKNLQELSAKLHIEHKDWDAARAVLKAAAVERYQDTSVFDFFLSKCAAEADLKSGAVAPEVAAARINELRDEAARFGHFESLRELDSLMAVHHRDHGLFAKVFFGTPHAKFREEMLAACPDMEIPSHYLLGGGTGRVLDLGTGLLDDGDAALRSGMLIHRTIASLCSDFYRPLYIGEMFTSLFPGEYYHPEHSPVRVANVVKRTRQWIKQHRLPIALTVKERLHSLRIDNRDFAIRLTANAKRAEVTGEVILIRRLRQSVAGTSFKAHDVAQALSISRSSALRLLNKGIALGEIQQSGFNRNTTYRFSHETL